MHRTGPLAVHARSHRAEVDHRNSPFAELHSQQVHRHRMEPEEDKSVDCGLADYSLGIDHTAGRIEGDLGQVSRSVEEVDCKDQTCSILYSQITYLRRTKIRIPSQARKVRRYLSGLV